MISNQTIANHPPRNFFISIAMSITDTIETTILWFYCSDCLQHLLFYQTHILIQSLWLRFLLQSMNHSASVDLHCDPNSFSWRGQSWHPSNRRLARNPVNKPCNVTVIVGQLVRMDIQVHGVQMERARHNKVKIYPGQVIKWSGLRSNVPNCST
jgi:hypothetical protein